MRREPVYLVLDVSGSMSGEPIEAVRNGVQVLVSSLRSDPYALETAYLSVITFDGTARQVVPLTELARFQPPDLQAGSTTSLGEALKVTKECIEREVQTSTPAAKGDREPLVFIMTNGFPSDDWQKGLLEFKKAKTGLVIACAAGPQANTNLLKQITETVVALESAGKDTFQMIFNDSLGIEDSIRTSTGD